MREIKVSEKLNELLLYVYYGITILAIVNLILYFSMYLVSPTKEIGIAFASIFCMNGLLWSGWMIRKHWKDDTIAEYKVDRYLWLGISCGLLYVCLQILDSGLWLWIPAIIFVIFYTLFLKDEFKMIVDWKRKIKIT